MIEAGAILLVFLVSAGIYLLARFGGPAPDPAQERERLEQYLAWLEFRREQAEQHGHDDEMKARIAGELAAARLQLARLAPASDR